MPYRKVVDKPYVESLGDLAFDACYHEIVANLLLCADHSKFSSGSSRKKRKLNSYSSLLSLNPSFSSENVIQFVRKRLDSFLLGIMSHKTRLKLVEEFFSVEDGEEDETLVHDTFMKLKLWAFLDSVLDSRFKELEIIIFPPEDESVEKLFNVISSRSPLMKKLQLDLDGQTFEPEEQVNFVTSLQGFKHLTSLSLKSIDEDWIPFLSLLGNSCPKLTKLFLESNSRYENEHLLALITGEETERFKEYFTGEAQETNIQSLVIPRELRSPLCDSLRELKLEGYSGCSTCSCNQYHIPRSSLAVIFRHLHNLKSFSSDCCLCNRESSYAIEILHQQLANAQPREGDVHQNDTVNSGIISFYSSCLHFHFFNAVIFQIARSPFFVATWFCKHLQSENDDCCCCAMS